MSLVTEFQKRVSRAGIPRRGEGVIDRRICEQELKSKAWGAGVTCHPVSNSWTRTDLK